MASKIIFTCDHCFGEIKPNDHLHLLIDPNGQTVVVTYHDQSLDDIPGYDLMRELNWTFHDAHRTCAQTLVGLRLKSPQPKPPTPEELMPSVQEVNYAEPIT